MIRAAIVVLGLAAAWVTPAVAEAIGDAERGAELFNRQCKACHQIGPEAIHRVGPRLNGVFGRKAGALEDFKYSRPMKKMGEEGLTWTLDTMDAYVKNPKSLVPGTRMNYRGLADDQARGALIAYLREWSDRPQNIPEAVPTARPTDHNLDPAILALKGDPDYGEYLSSECLTCHKADGGDDGIPSITGWPEEDFVVAMHAYKQKLRPHPVMQMMAGRLNNDEIAALAAWFAGQGE
jgi:cytochrome c